MKSLFPVDTTGLQVLKKAQDTLSKAKEQAYKLEKESLND